MANDHNFEHLPLVRREDGPARFQRPVFGESPLTRTNRANRGGHSSSLEGQVVIITASWKAEQDARTAAGLPAIDQGIPLLLQIDPTLDIDDLRNHFGFEIISELGPIIETESISITKAAAHGVAARGAT